MAHSSLLGTDSAPAIPAGRDSASLGPSDSSDSGSDMAGLDALDNGDSAGTGERRSAGADTGRPDGADIGPDSIVDDPDGGRLVDEDATLAGGADDPVN